MPYPTFDELIYTVAPKPIVKAMIGPFPPPYGRSPAQDIVDAVRALRRATLYALNPLDMKRLIGGDAIKVCIPNDWLNRFLLNHKGLRNWLRWHFT